MWDTIKNGWGIALFGTILHPLFFIQSGCEVVAACFFDPADALDNLACFCEAELGGVHVFGGGGLA